MHLCLPPVGMKVHVNGIQNVNTLPYEVTSGDVMFKVVKTLVSYNMRKSLRESILPNRLWFHSLVRCNCASPQGQNKSPTRSK